MVRKDLKVWLVLSVLVVIGTGGICQGGGREELNATYELVRNGSYEQAESAFKAIVVNYYSGSWYYAFQAQADLVKLYIKQGKETAAETAYDKLVQDFADVENLPALLYRIGTTYEESGNDSKAESVYKTIVSGYPGSDHGFKSQKGLLGLYVKQKRDGDVQEGVNKLLRDYSGHARTPAALSRVGCALKDEKKYDKAEQVLQLLAENYPGNRYALEAQEHIIYMMNKQDIDAGGAIDKLVSDFNDNSGLPKALLDIAIRFEILEKYSESREVYQRLGQVHPNSPYGAEVAAETLDYFERVDYGKTLAAVDKLISDFEGDSRSAASIPAW